MSSMRRGGLGATLDSLMQGNYELYGQGIANGHSNVRDLGPKPGSSGAMKRNEARKQQVNETKKRRKGDSASDSGGPHASALTPHRAILGKGTNYARNGATYIRSNRASEYSTFGHLGPPDFQVSVAGHASITRISNFEPTLSGQQQPYRWQAHHLIPGEAFYTEDSSGKPVFNKEENFDLLLQTPYDIDHGHNLIILPGVSWAVPVHALLQHPNNHNGYTLDVMQGLKDIDSAIDTLRGQEKPHEAIVANVFDDLKKLEENLWSKMLKRSRKAVRGAAEGQRYDGPWCRWQTQEGRDYGGWPALW
ncbi:AHH domain-containing protein [Myxococcus sp. RHSTA-1-4]|uniref:AHH domain-containing protein n=1 Tax=Myxococcus sp. RHSTA-1-4 TaxID=2874601 RepID=UPI001CC03A59|nr:AHH domain-containing protein [Myxococcus sp. RHSTA-1-4]MBZ4420559.1 AHH domain-containing protein [Myxococcus sp. RHSTA-1-4]